MSVNLTIKDPKPVHFCTLKKGDVFRLALGAPSTVFIAVGDLDIQRCGDMRAHMNAVYLSGPYAGGLTYFYPDMPVYLLSNMELS